ncbi:MAG: hypothetical protein RL148_986 [Planctomycetota bacterium]|jgi:hypothetical protein
MKSPRLWAAACLVLSTPFAFLLLERRGAAEPVPAVRFASFNAAMNRNEPGMLLDELRSGKSVHARQVADIVQRNLVDVVLLCEIDRDAAGESARLFQELYLNRGPGGAPLERPFLHVVFEPSNTGVPSGHDLDGDGTSNGPADAHGFGRFEGQYAMALFSRFPVQQDRIRTFRELRWESMPGNQLPREVVAPDAVPAMRLSSKSHWDVPIQLNAAGLVVHALCSHPTPPAFDGPEDRNGRRNHDEIRFWVDYLTPGAGEWIVDDKGTAGGLDPAAHFVVLGDLNCDPADGDARRDAMLALLAHPRVHDLQPKSTGADVIAKKQWGVNATHRGDPLLDTADFDDEPGKGPGNLRVDYALPSRSLELLGSSVFWPAPGQPGAKLVEVSDHRLVWVDVVVR